MNPRFLDYKKAILSAISAVNLLAMVGIFAFTWFRFYLYQIGAPFYYRYGNWLFFFIYGISLYAITSVLGGYRIGRLRCSEIIYSNFLSLALANVFTFFIMALIARFWLPAGPILIMTLVEYAVVVIWSLFSSRLYHSVYPPRRMLLVSGSNTSEHLIEKMNKRPDKYEIRECIDADTEIHLLRQKIDEYDAIVICDVGAQMQELLINYCFRVNKRFYLVPTIEHIIIANASKVHLFDTPLLLCRNQGLQPEQRFAKRALDLFVSSLGILVTSPFMLIIALCIYAYDRGPVLFKQERLTLGGKVFTLYKFRSMVVDAEKDGIARLASKNDARITPIGKIIRAIRFDELPQLFNIFKGDMSLVGPRPERPEIAEEYASTLPNFSYRLKTKAGLTGYAQVMGKYNTTPQDKLLLDLMYIENYSFLLDIRILLMTVKIFLMPDSTEGVDESNPTNEEK
ncbi:MAG: sugar transferase [Christensenellales bacterium]